MEIAYFPVCECQRIHTLSEHQMKTRSCMIVTAACLCLFLTGGCNESEVVNPAPDDGETVEVESTWDIILTGDDTLHAEFSLVRAEAAGSSLRTARLDLPDRCITLYGAASGISPSAGRFAALDSSGVLRCNGGIDRFCFVSTKTILAVNRAELHRSTDGGWNWTSVTPPAPNMGTAIYSHSGNTSGLLFAGHTGSSPHGGISLSSDQGRNWAWIGPAGMSVWLLEVNRQTGTLFAIVGYYGDMDVYRSRDAGVTWEKRYTAAWTHPYSGADDAGGIYICSHSGRIVQSRDDGESWSETSISPACDVIHCFGVSGDGLLLAAGIVGGAFMSTDRGATWSNVKSGLSGVATLESALPLGNDRWLLGSSRGLYGRRTSDEEWTRMAPALDNLGIGGISKSPDGSIWLSGDRHIYCSTDQGETASRMDREPRFCTLEYKIEADSITGVYTEEEFENRLRKVWALHGRRVAR